MPAVFTARTGRDHWEVLLRARAIENGRGSSPHRRSADRRASRTDVRWSSILWGTVIAQAPDSVMVVHADLDLDRVAEVAWDPGAREPTTGRVRGWIVGLGNRESRDSVAALPTPGMFPSGSDSVGEAPS